MMPPLADWLGLGGLATALVLCVLRFAPQMNFRRRFFVAAGLYAVVIFPLAGHSFAGWLRGMVGDLSMTSLVLLMSALVLRLRGAGLESSAWSAKERATLRIFVCLLAVLLYPCALGLGMFDPYRLGYGGLALVIPLTLAAVIALARGQRLLPLCLALALAAWSAHGLESSNLWDYLIDAPLALYALGGALHGVLRGLQRRFARRV